MTVYLRQKDFVSGTYRIKIPGIYVLKESIVFQPDPDSNRPDKPSNGWFAAITIEVDDVVIDLNKHKISCSQKFVDNHFAKGFAVILLNNSLYGGGPNTLSSFGSIFPGETEVVTASGVTIKNGRIGRNPHFGIKGYYNNHLTFSNLKISDGELAGIWLTSTTGVRMNNIFIRGNNHPIRVKPRLNQLFFLVQALKNLGTPEALAILPTVEKLFIDERKLESKSKCRIAENTSYGVLITNGFRAPFPTVIDKEDLPRIFQFSASYPSKDAIIKNLKTTHIRVEQKQVIILALGANPGIPNGVTGAPVNPRPLGISGGIPYEEFFKPGTTEIQLTPYLRSLLQTIDLYQKSTGILIISPEFLQKVLDPVNPVFDTQFVQPFFDTDSANRNRGVFGVALYQVKNLATKKISVKKLVNYSKQVPRHYEGESLYPDFKNTLIQTTSWGIFIDLINDSKWDKVKIDDIISAYGKSIGLQLAHSNDNILNKVFIKNIMGRLGEVKVLEAPDSNGNQICVLDMA
jgi:hypothetical protein